MAYGNEKLALRYARALYDARQSEGSAGNSETAAEELQTLASAYESSSELQDALANPMFEEAEKRAVWSRLVEENTGDQTLRRFLGIVYDRGRIEVLPAIAEAYQRVLDEASGSQKVEIVTARQVDSSESEKIEYALSAKIGGTPSYEWSVQPELIGGMIIRYGGRVVDGSLSGKVERLEQQLSGE